MRKETIQIRLAALVMTALAAIVGAPVGLADDTEIYLTNDAAKADEPMVMFSIDWRPNLTATVCSGNECDALYPDYLDKDPQQEKIVAFELYRAVLKKVFEPLQGVKVGLMINHDDGSGKSCSGPGSGKDRCTNGGFIPFGFQSLQAGDANGAKAAFDKKLSDMPLPQGNESHKYQASELFFEFFRYLTGGDVYNGHNGWESFDGSRGDPDQNIDTEYVSDTRNFSWDPSIESSGRYRSPLSDASACAKIFTVNFMFGTLNDDGDSDTAITASKAQGGMGGIALGKKTNGRFEAVLAWLRDTDLSDGTFGSGSNLEGDQSVTSYFLVPSANNTENGFARAGGTQAAIELSDDPQELIDTLTGILNEIMSISTTFVAASVPMNVFNRSEVLDNVYIALFQPQETADWSGNVKKLKVKTGLDDVFLIDANGDLAIAPDGRIKYGALTYWTDGPSLPYPDSNVTGQEAQYMVDGRDGRFVPRGGAGQQVAGVAKAGSSDPGLSNADNGARQLFTEPTSGSGLMPLNADSDTAAKLQSALTATSAEEAECLLRYARGYQIGSLSDCSALNARPWLLGSILHSRPLPLNYGGDLAAPEIRLVVGGNDGYLRMIRNTLGGSESGEEVWAFMPQAVMPNLKKLASTGGATKHLYGVDGPAAAYTLDVNRDGSIDPSKGDKVWIFFGLRRGGKAYYALDVSNPDAPSFMWSINKGDSGFPELGLTFSQPKIGMLEWDDRGPRPVAVFGGGYDINKDQRPGPGTDDSEGNAVFVVDAETGELVWKAVKAGAASSTTALAPGLVDSIPSNVALLESGNGMISRLYVGDTGGVVWRADFPGTDRAKWTLKPVLSVGRHATSVDRRFFHEPDVALSSDGNGNFDAVMIGSGDRANPLDRTIANEFYLFKDRKTTVGDPPSAALDPSALADLTDNCLQDDSLSCPASLDLTNGWRLALEAEGEKALAAPLTLGGAILFSTYRPPVSSPGVAQCGPREGSGALYAVKLQDATAVINLSSSTDAGGVLGKEDRSQALDAGGIPAEVVPLPVAGRSVLSGGVPILRPDLKVDVIDTRLQWKTFWYQAME
jgi:type IV pilus assembly protein PilY1